MAPSVRRCGARRALEEIFFAGLAAASPYAAVKSRMRVTPGARPRLMIDHLSFDLGKIKNIYLIGAGKGVCAMAQAASEVLGTRIVSGCVVTKYGHAQGAPNAVEVIEAAHPLPDAKSARAAKRLLSIASGAGKGDLVLFLLTGGASALACAPALGLTLAQKKATTRLLVNSGARIGEINAVRKHLSAIKGGQLAASSRPATVVSLVVSDVVGDDLAAIGSGPTAPDPTTFAECLSILKKYGLTGKVPKGVLKHLKDGAAGKIEETPKPGNRAFKDCHNVIVAGNSVALEAARKKAASLGYAALVLTSTLTGPTHAAARLLASVLKEIRKTGNPIKPPACVLLGGETALKVTGGGKGGRNQEFALVSAVGIDGLRGAAVLSAGTDGTDGPTEADGAFAFADTLKRAGRAGLDAQDFLSKNDSYHFFKKLGDLFITGPTGTNVMDMAIGLVGPLVGPEDKVQPKKRRRGP